MKSGNQKRKMMFCGIGWSLVLVCGAAVAGSTVPQLKLIENGEARCVIAIDEKASRPERFGAKEIAAYLKKVTGAEVAVVNRVDSKRWKDWRKLVTVEVAALPELKADGFVLDVREDGVSVVGHDPRGALYGCYEVLKRSCGIKWLIPGEDGEYFTPKKTVSLPVGRIVMNPYLPIRGFTGQVEINQFEWAARNYSQSAEWCARFAANDLEQVRKRDRMEDCAVCGVGRGGHMLSEVMLGWGDGKEPAKKIAERLYAEHPEYFPMINGKRKMTWGPYDPNPCVSNPALLDRMAKNMIVGLRGKHACDTNLIMGNNDTSAWCECDACRALDAPEMAGTRGARSDRFWHMVGELAKRIWKELPEAKLGAWAYQDFWYPPKRVKIDPRLRVLVSFNNQCWRHSVDDPDCPMNAEFRKIFGLWKETGLPEVYNRDEIADEGSPGRYEPSEYVLYRNMMAYPEYGCAGDQFFVYSSCPAYYPWAAKWPPYYGRNYWWRAMWQTAWITAQVTWDKTLSFDKLYEECNSLYYGRAWEGGMKEFRQYLTECFTNTPGCIGYGSGAPIGKCLDKPGSQEKLESLLDKALLAACAAGDERARRHVETDREIFALTWLKGRKTYVDNYLESEAYVRKGEIVVDGVLDEKDWRDAKVISGFQRKYETRPPDPAQQPTEVRVTYDLDTLYFGVTVFEPEMDGQRAGLPAEVDRADGWKALGDHLELFYQFPDMYEKAFHLAINREGAIVDGLQKSASDRDITFETGAKWAVKKEKDRWTLEIAIPANEIGSKLMTGMDWRINVARCRNTHKGRGSENTSCCHGYFYAPANFLHLKLK